MNTDIHTLSGAYAVDALDPQERAEFERHLTECASCRAEVAGLREAAAQLGEISASTPPPRLRADILAGIEHIRPLPPEVGVARSARLPWRRAALLVAASIALGLVLWQPWNSATPSGAQIGAITRVEHAGDVTVRTDDLAGGASVTWYHSASLDRAVAVVRGMPAPPAGRVYQLWLQDASGRMRPAGFLPAKADSSVLLAGSVTAARAAGITVEPSGGSAAPTSTPISLVTFARA